MSENLAYAGKGYIGFDVLNMGFKAHMTLLYTGPMTDEQIKIARHHVAPHILKPLLGTRKNIELFGPNNTVPVVTVELYAPEYHSLIDLRNKLIDAGVPSPSEFGWSPHVTLDMDCNIIQIPKVLRFHKLSVR